MYVCTYRPKMIFPYCHLVQGIIIVASFPSCFSLMLLEDQLLNDHHDQPHSLNLPAGPDILGVTGDEEGNLKASLGGLTRKYGTETVDLPRLYHMGVASSSPQIVNVDYFGAKGDGITDDSEAFKKAWEEACMGKDAVLVVPKQRTYHLKPVTFSGPCNSGLTMKIDGTIEASTDLSDFKDRHWLLFESLQNFNVQGGGTINGNGKIWWQNSCKIDKSRPCKGAPTAVTFLNCTNLGVSGLKIVNSQQIHVSFQICVNVKAWNLKVVAPENSPNTDGIHITGTQNVKIMSSVIKTGDDCISIVGGSKNVNVMDITCGPGHGISIGSLGKGNSKDLVLNVDVNRATLSGTTNGVRIKTWQGGSGYAKNIRFQNIIMHNVTNPIIIDQYYCDQPTPCHEQDLAVKVENVGYENIKGTSASEVAINLNCSKIFPCKAIVLQDINLVRESDGNTEASCINVCELSSRGRISPTCS